VHGIDPATSRMVTGDVVRETATALTNVENLMQACGASLENIAGLTVLVRDYAYVSVVRRHLEAKFADRVPALQFANYPLPGDLNVQFHVAAL
jgi:enamine deaminase RidA (YjgF/YER057c/UK114 family)